MRQTNPTRNNKNAFYVPRTPFHPRNAKAKLQNEPTAQYHFNPPPEYSESMTPSISASDPEGQTTADPLQARPPPSSPPPRNPSPLRIDSPMNPAYRYHGESSHDV